MSSLAGKSALVTGAARGIGAAVAVELARQGASVYTAANELEDHLQKVVKACGEAHPSGKAAYGMFDFLKSGDAERMVAAAVEALGRIDIVVNNAGLRISKDYGEYSESDFDKVVAVNLKAPFLIGQAVIPHMKAAGGGRIVNIASQMGLVTAKQIALYGLTKAALIHLTKSMALELAPHKIIVNAVSPGPIMTEFNAERIKANPGLQERRSAEIVAGRYGRSDEVAELVAFLASMKGTYVMGENIVIDGGYVIH
jgi:NAD(P)-dependent dehydrogenase (short-subunit alcohol dehydrogenase family)